MEPGCSCHMLIKSHVKYTVEDRLPDHTQMREMPYGAHGNYFLEDSWAPFYFSNRSINLRAIVLHQGYEAVK